MRAFMSAIRYLAVAMCVVSCAAAVKSSSRSSFKITINTAQEVFKQAAKIRVDILLKNTSDKEMTVWRDADNEVGESAGYDIQVFYEKSGVAPETKYHRVLRNEESPTVPLLTSAIARIVAPGETAKDAMIVNKFYDMRKPGKYRILVQLADPATKIIVKSNVITITVTPEQSEHPCRLPDGQRCEDLLK